MPTPYQLDFFQELSGWFTLTVVYFSKIEDDRQWKLDADNSNYAVIWLQNNWIAKAVQRKFPSFHYSSAIKELLLNADLDIAIVNGTYWSPNVNIAIKTISGRGKTVAYWAEPVFASKSILKSALKRIGLRPIFSYCDYIFAIGRIAAQSYSDLGFKKKIFNIPYNINADVFSAAREDDAKRQALRKKNSIGSEVVFLSSGSLIWRKGMDTIISAFRSLATEKNCHLVIIGDGPDKAALQALAGGDSRIHFAGFIEKDEMPDWFAIADVFVFASRYDGWGLVVNEAISSGCALVISDKVGAASDLLEDGQNAIIVAADDLPGFTGAMQKLLDNEVLREEMGRKSAELGRIISSKVMAKKVYDIYQLDKQ